MEIIQNSIYPYPPFSSNFFEITSKKSYLSKVFNNTKGSIHAIRNHMCPLRSLFYFFNIFNMFLKKH
jgi:hypothetical protein